MVIEFIPLNPNFGAEVKGVDFSKPVPRSLAEEINLAFDKYGVLVFRKTGLTDEAHIAFSKHLGDLDDISQFIAPNAALNRRSNFLELFDASNLDPATDKPLQEHDRRYQYNKGNTLWHVDSSFNARRAAYSLLLAHELPQNGAGDTHFADTRTSYRDLPQEKKDQIENLICAHSLWQSRKLAAPGYVAGEYESKNLVERYHKLVQTNPDGSKALYVAAHASHVVGMDREEGFKLIWELIDHATQPQYTIVLSWDNPGDLIMWDNRCVMHRATEFPGNTVYRRDMRRTTVHDGSPNAWGYNPKPEGWQPTQTKAGMGNHIYARTNGKQYLTNNGVVDGDWYASRADLGLPRISKPVKNVDIDSSGIGDGNEIKVQGAEIAAH